jgi:peptidoglycan hydrolase-like protein with peptidoglycan-binding domain
LSSIRRPRAPRIRLLLVVALATGLLASASAGPVAAGVPTFPYQSSGDLGTNVRAAQYLLRARGADVPVDGRFGASTRIAVRSFQARQRLAATGVISPATWARLVTTVRPGSRGDAVRAVQSILRVKRGAPIRVTGRYDAPTRAAVVAFQRHRGLAAVGVVGGVTWRELIAHFEQPKFRLVAVCPYATGANGHRAHWGTSSTVTAIAVGATAVYRRGYGAVAVGDISSEHGGPLRGHATHRAGLDADVRPMRRANDQCGKPVTWYRWSGGRKVCCNPAYDRTATRQLIKSVRAASGGHLDLVAFNDPRLIAEGWTIPLAGHDDHLHFSFCEQRHPTWGYSC